MGIELGIGESLIIKAIAESTGRATTKIKEDLRKEGDLGKVAMVGSQLLSRLIILLMPSRIREIRSRPCSSRRR